MHIRRRWWARAAAVLAFALLASPASAATTHEVEPGETLWSIAVAHNFTTRTIAVFNRVPVNAKLIAGQTIEIPTEAEGAAALQAAGIVPRRDPASSTRSTSAHGAGSSDCASANGVDPGVIVSAPGMAHVPSPWGELHLAPAAADAWNAMRNESLQRYGTDIYPSGPLSGYRTYSQQAYVYCLYHSGEGPPADPPGSSNHETGTAADLATPEMRWVVDHIGWKHGWRKVRGPGEWWHVDYVGG